MSERKDQPAALKRRIAVLEGQLEAERRINEHNSMAIREALYELVDLRMRHQAALAALRGEA